MGPLGDLSDALPPGWTFPAVVNDALAGQRFDDIPVAVQAATDIVSAIVRADAEVPDEGVLDSYRNRFEEAASVEALLAQVSDSGIGSPSPAPIASEPGSQRSPVADGQAASVEWPRNPKTYLVIEQPSATMVQGQTP